MSPSQHMTKTASSGQHVARSVQFRREREASWEELEELITKVESGGISNVSAQDLSRLPHLYRGTLSALNVARSTSLDRNLVMYLESLSTRAYLCVYSTRRRPLHAVMQFFVRSFPLAVWRMRWHLVMATTIFALGMGVACVMVLEEPEAFTTFVDGAYAQGRGPTSTASELRAVLFSGSELSAEDLGQFASVLMTHNAKVGMMCFVLGFALGLPTLYLLFQNGAVLGAFTAIHMLKGLSVEFFSWLLPHGITEILAVLLCGAAGFLVAEAVLFPGRRTRLQNLAVRGREAGVVVIGSVVLFVIAGLIEGVFRQTVQSMTVRYTVAGSTAIFWLAYFVGLGWWQARRSAQREEEVRL